MNKFLRVILILVIILAVIVGCLAFMAPKEVTVSRSTAVINAPQSVVFEQMTHFKAWPHWSPWHEMDPDMTITYTGTDGEAGSAYHWVGTEEKKMGSGDMTLVAIKGDSMQYHLQFLKPWKSEADGYLIAQDLGNGTTKATWMFHTVPKFPGSIFLVFMDMDKMLGKDFEHGLDNLKKYAEAQSKAASPTNTSRSNDTAVAKPAHHP
ncbi:SRPBCC family protein [Chitinophagaceae bacterium MMS25-I14]